MPSGWAILVPERPVIAFLWTGPGLALAGPDSPNFFDFGTMRFSLKISFFGV